MLQYQKLIFRELKTEKELLEHYRLRYEIYSNSRLNGFIEPNDEQLDIDEYDAYSKHFGLFLVDGECETLIGGNRVILTFNESEAIADFSRLRFLQFTTDSNHIIEYLHKQQFNQSEVVDVSRLFICEQYRSLLPVTKLIHSMIVYCGFSNNRYSLVVTTCNTSHKPFYGRYGFYNIPGTSDSYWEKQGVFGSILMAEPSDVPEKYAHRFRKQAEFYNQNGYLEYSLSKNHKQTSCIPFDRRTNHNISIFS